MKKVSVVVPCYNATKYIDRCMRYLLEQTIGIDNMEIILVDDASTDERKTLHLLLEYEARYPDTIIVISLEQNMRQGGARNAGISYAGGEYLMFCDVDDWLVSDAMEKLYHIAKETEADVVEFRNKEVTDIIIEAETLSGEEKKSHIYEFDEGEEKRQFIMSSSENCALGCWTKFYRMSVIQDNQIRFAEYLICEEPSFTLPVRFYEKRHVLTKEELNLFKENTLQLFPEILQNPYVVKKEDGWNMLMKGLLEMELTDGNVPELNRLMRYFLQRYQELCSEE